MSICTNYFYFKTLKSNLKIKINIGCPLGQYSNLYWCLNGPLSGSYYLSPRRMNVQYKKRCPNINKLSFFITSLQFLLNLFILYRILREIFFKVILRKNILVYFLTSLQCKKKEHKKYQINLTIKCTIVINFIY